VFGECSRSRVAWNGLSSDRRAAYSETVRGLWRLYDDVPIRFLEWAVKGRIRFAIFVLVGLALVSLLILGRLLPGSG
jgi:hypothetical protein